MNGKYILHCQYKEWYGDEEYVGEDDFGRHKNKGGTSFVFDAPPSIRYLSSDRILKDFNKVYDRPDRFCRYEARVFEPYNPEEYAGEEDDIEMRAAEFVNGRVQLLSNW
jgi:hypothetical protein